MPRGLRFSATRERVMQQTAFGAENLRELSRANRGIPGSCLGQFWIRLRPSQQLRRTLPARHWGARPLSRRSRVCPAPAAEAARSNHARTCEATADRRGSGRKPVGARRVSDTELRTLLEVMPEIAAAVNDTRSESIQRDALRVLVDVARFDVSRIDWNEVAMSTALFEGLFSHADHLEVMDALAADEPASPSPSPDLMEPWDALTTDELRGKTRQAGRGEHVSLA